MSLLLTKNIASGELFPGFGACVFISIPANLFLYWIPLLLFEFILLLLVIYVGYIKLFKSGSKFDMRRLINVVIRDNILYFLV